MAEIHVQTKKQHSTPTWIWIVVVLLIAVAAAVYFLMRNNKTTVNNGTTTTTTSYQPVQPQLNTAVASYLS